ncbi:MAG: FkbM family methyltransferase [Mariniblastus sp.]|nr:FkbM family methyltransferase [Mariniblastus sp.]
MKHKECTLPNGMDINYSSKGNLAALKREFESDIYHKHGIELKDGDCIFDVGANIGFFMLYLNQHLDDASVFSFEPIPDTFELLKRNAERHNNLNLQLYNVGLSDEAGTATFTHYPKSNICSTMFPQGSDEYLDNNLQYVIDKIRERGAVPRMILDRTPSFIRRLLFHLIFCRYYRAQVSVECKLCTISDVIDEQGIQRIDYLKVDTEGAELNVLKGIRSDHWPIIRQAVIEVHDGSSGLQNVIEILDRNGFHSVVEQPRETLSHLRMVYAVKKCSPSLLTVETSFPSQVKTLS